MPKWLIAPLRKKNSMNTLGRSILTVWPSIFLIKACCHALGWICKFVQRCKKFYMIGPRSRLFFTFLHFFLCHRDGISLLGQKINKFYQHVAYSYFRTYLLLLQYIHFSVQVRYVVGSLSDPSWLVDFAKCTSLFNKFFFIKFNRNYSVEQQQPSGLVDCSKIK